jgi:phospholipase C
MTDKNATTSAKYRDDDRSKNRITRRKFLAGAGAAAGALALGGGAELAKKAAAKTTPGLPSPASSGIEHVVLVMMENRSFDHLLGWMPKADGKQTGLSYRDMSGRSYPTHYLAPDYQGCGHPDPDHSYNGGRVEYNGGACDGWLRAGSNDVYSIGYYKRIDLAFLGQAATSWTTFDRYFAAIMAETYPNRIYQHAAQTDRITNTSTISKLPTIWDLLANHGLSGRYYYSDLPFLALWGEKYLSISRPVATFYADCAAGTLPQVSYVEPRFGGESDGISDDDHPHADIRNGEAFLNRIYKAVTTSPSWSKTLLIINFDEWGGFYDHVPPPKAPIPAADKNAGNEDGLRGFRVPALAISPWSRRGYVPHKVYDHTSVLKLIEWRWQLPNLTVRDAQANNLATSLDFGNPNQSAPQFAVPSGPFGAPCPPATPGNNDELDQLRTLAQSYGWPTY